MTAAHTISRELEKEGVFYSDRNLFTRLLWIDREMLGSKLLYNRDVWWKTLLGELGLSRRAPWIHRVTLKYWEAYAKNSPPFRDANSTILAVKRMGLKIALVSDTDGTPGMKRKRIRL
ncbi:hypothetical protein J2P12_06325, partial [Candidatus Bathyarchaeota archaeon]|nr:hypothetical protein [Candidatus Bathyarchaeota archaeon]